MNDAPTLAGGSASATNDETTLTPFSTLSLADVDISTTDIVTITLSSGDANGTIASGASWISAGTYTLSGLTSVVATALEALVFTPAAHEVTAGSTVTTGLTVVASQTAGGSTVSATNTAASVVATAVNDPPTIAGVITSNQGITDETTTLQPLADVTVSDVDISTTEKVTITLSSGNSDGTLSSGATYVSAGSYTLTGTPSSVSTALAALVFTPTAHQVTPGDTVTTTLTLTAKQIASSGTSTTTTGSTTIIVATAAADAPTVSGVITSSQAITDETTTLAPFATATIADADLSTTEIVTITLSSGDSDGTLSSAAAYISAGFYTLVGTPSAISTALQALVFTPTAHQVSPGSTVTTSLTVAASQTAGGSTLSTTNSATSVVATAVNDPPTVAGGGAFATNDETTVSTFATLTVADVDTSATDIVTITLSSGDANGTIASGAIWVSAGAYTLVGLTSVVNTALEALVFTPTAHEVTAGSTVTTGAAIVVSQTGGGSTVGATNTATFVVATAVNDPPTLAGGVASATNDETTLQPFSHAHPRGC